MSPPPAAAADASLGRDILYAARYYLANRWTLLAAGGLAIALGLLFGGWGWLVAAGLAPLVLSLLPCAAMCAIGACAMCRSGKSQSVGPESAAVSAVSAGSSATPSNATMNQSTAEELSCCGAAQSPASQPQQVQPTITTERKDSHA